MTAATTRPEDISLEILIERIGSAGFGDDVEWAENLTPPLNAHEFAREVIFVICNSGMRFTTARTIYDKVMAAIEQNRPVARVFGHAGKGEAIERVWRERDFLYSSYMMAGDKLAYLETLPWIGEITKYHLAKNFGLQYAKPDVHLQRLGNAFDMTPQALCEKLAAQWKLKVATVDTLLWRAAALGILNTATGTINPKGK